MGKYQTNKIATTISSASLNTPSLAQVNTSASATDKASASNSVHLK